MLIGECADEGVEDEGFCSFLVVTLIQNYPQAEGMKLYRPSMGSWEGK